MTEGKLENKTVPELVYRHYNSSSTGCLNIEENGDTRKLFFEDGQIVYADSTADEDRFGEVLESAGKITSEQIEEAVENQQNGHKFGRTLVELGFIPPKELPEAVKLQVRHIVYNALHSESGSYSFENNTGEADIISLNLSTPELILEGLKKIRNPRIILKGIGHMEGLVDINPHPETAMQEVKLSDFQQHIISLINGEIPVKELCNNLDKPAMTVCKNIFILVSLGILKKVPEDER